ncbi:MAG: signal peptidase II [Candidatus Riflebacteria bacterium]|nr:signal peptidase II [Candidatus Riflebacteria bacterium]
MKTGNKMKTLTTLFKTAFFSVTSIISMILHYPFYLYRNLRFYLIAPSILLYATIFFVLDRATKWAAQLYLIERPIVVIKDFFTLTFVKNPGVAFGLFPEWKLPPIIMAVAMIGIICYYSFQLPSSEKLTRWALALLVGGALGNLYDRLVYSYVVDFFLFHIGKYDFPVFNVADVAIDLGVFLLFIDIFFYSTDEAPQEVPAPA